MNWNLHTPGKHGASYSWALVVLILVVFQPAAIWAQGFSADLSGHEHKAAPGDVIQGSIRVSSMAEEPITLTVTVGDYVRGQDDSETEASYTFVNELGLEERSATAWISYAPEMLDLEPGESKEVRYQITVPADNTLTGSYWGVIFVQPVESEEDLLVEAESDAETPSVGIFIKFRYAVRIFVTIGNDPPAKPKFVGLDVEPLDDGLLVKPVLSNEGKVFIKPTITVQLRDHAGSVVYQSDSFPNSLLPESVFRAQIEARPMYLPDGEYLMVVIGDTGDPQMIAAQSRITLSGLPSEPPPEETDAEPPAPPGPRGHNRGETSVPNETPPQSGDEDSGN